MNIFEISFSSRVIETSTDSGQNHRDVESLPERSEAIKKVMKIPGSSGKISQEELFLLLNLLLNTSGTALDSFTRWSERKRDEVFLDLCCSSL